MSPDLSLLRRYVEARDERALAAVISQHQGLVYGTCLRILGNRADAEDAAQECFLRLLRHAAAVRSSLAGWLHRCATSTSLNALKQSHARQRREQRYGQDRGPEIQDGDELTWKEIAPHVDRALEALPEELRQVLVEAYLLQRNRTEIARELGISRVTLYRRLDEGIRLVRRHLREAGVTVSVAVLGILLEEHAAVAAPASLGEALAHLAESVSRSGDAAAAGSGPGAQAGPSATLRAGRWATPAKSAAVLVGLILTLALLVGVWQHVRPDGGRVVLTAAASEPTAPAAPAADANAFASAAPAAAAGGGSLARAVEELLEGPRPAEGGGANRGDASADGSMAPVPAGDEEWYPLWITPEPSARTRPTPAQSRPAAGVAAARKDVYPFASDQTVARRVEGIEAARKAEEAARRQAEAATHPPHYRPPPSGINIAVTRGTVSNGQIITKSRTRIAGPFPLHINGPRPSSSSLPK